MQSLILLRGLPGSGKSTLARLLSEGGKYPVFSVDDYFTNELTNEYHFDYRKNHLAYKQCEENTRKALSAGSEKIFVDNTFTLEWELEIYFRLAAEFNCRIFVLTVENRHGGSNIHEVSREQILKMAEGYKVILY
jgi:predicted kinase